MYVNSVAVVGNLTSDPRMGEGSIKVVNFRLGVNRRRRPDGETDNDVKERADFVDVECWGAQAEYIHSTLHKGDRAIVVGQIKYEQWTDQDDNPRSRVCIRASAVGPSLEFNSVSV